MGSKKELTVERATKLLEPFSSRAPQQSEKPALYDTLDRLPPGVSMKLVTAVLKHQAAKNGTDVARRLRPEYASAIASVLKAHRKSPEAMFLLAALPKNPSTWGTALAEVNDGLFYLGYHAMSSKRRGRAQSLAPYATDPRIVAGARAQIAKLEPSKDNEAMLLLALEGSKASVAVLAPAVRELLENRHNLDWLTYDLAPLMTQPATVPLRELILGKTTKRNAASRGLLAGESLGLTGADSFKFKIAMYGKYSKIRLWFDSTKDPWYDAIWNWNELVDLPRVKKSTTPLAELEAVMAHAMTGHDVVRALQGTKWERYELTTPHRGPFRTLLEAWVAKQLHGVSRSS
jgi:hypothetical protein